MPSRLAEIDSAVLETWGRAWYMPAPRSVSQWADAERHVPANSGSPWPGRWRTDRVPYLREVMDAMGLSHPARRVTVVKAAQVGGSEAALNAIGQIMDETPVPVIVALPSIDLMRSYNRVKLTTMIHATPTLTRRVRDVVSRDEEGSTTGFKVFGDGYLKLATAASAASLRMLTARVVIEDEKSAFQWDVDGEGDPSEILRARMSLYSGREKHIEISTPGTMIGHDAVGNCRITVSYEQSSRGRYFVACPECGEGHPLEWDSLRWPKGRPEEARHHCPHCGAGVEHRHKPAMIAAGWWHHERPELVEVHAGYSIGGLYSPAISWADLARDWEAAQGDEGKVKSFVTTKIGRAWRIASGEAPDWQRLYDRREEWAPGTVPADGLVATAGIDVQRDRLEMSVWAWGKDRQCWLVDHLVIPGSPFAWGTWETAATALETVYPHASGGAVPISMAAVDSSDGVTTAQVYTFTRKMGARRVIAIKGRANLPQPIAPGARIDVRRDGKAVGGMKPWLVGTDHLKGQLYGALRLDRPTTESGEAYPPGYVHLPVHVAGEEFCRQLVAEELRRERVRGAGVVMKWVAVRARNEALDCWVYAAAAAALLGVNRWGEGRWADVQAAVAMNRPSTPVHQPSLELPAVAEGDAGDVEAAAIVPVQPSVLATASAPAHAVVARQQLTAARPGYFGRWR